MRILTHGQALWCKSAYAHQLRMLMDNLVSMGHDVGQACTYGFQGRKIILDKITLYPHVREQNGQDVIAFHAQDFGADIVLSLGDVFLFDPEIWKAFKWVAWATVDSSPIWPRIKHALSGSYRQIAYSRYGQRVMQESGFENAGYIPLAFDPEVYFRVPMNEARAECQIPQDRFVVGIVQANRQVDNRKNFFDQIIAFRQFQKKHSDAFLYFHTCMSAFRGGFNLTELCDELGMTKGRDYDATEEYIEVAIGASDEQMRNVYNSFDVLLQATKAEGFGVPALEASACDKPVIYTDYAALPEAVHYGYRVGYEKEWQPAGSWYARPTHDSIVDALERAYAVQPYDLNRGEPTQYRIDLVADNYWQPYLTQLQESLEAVTA